MLKWYIRILTRMPRLQRRQTQLTLTNGSWAIVSRVQTQGFEQKTST